MPKLLGWLGPGCVWGNLNERGLRDEDMAMRGQKAKVSTARTVLGVRFKEKV